MDTQKIAFLWIGLCLSISAEAQYQVNIKKGSIRAFSTLSPGKMLHSSNHYFYGHGGLEYYFEKNRSASGDTYFMLGSSDPKTSQFMFNHSTFFGVNQHFISGNSDFYVGLHPGMAITKLNLTEEPHTGVNPLVSSTIGYNLYFFKYLHFFVQSRLILGKHGMDRPEKLGEIRFSAGLGLNY